MSDHESRRGSFLEELKRRRVVRVAVGYAAAVFVILQAAEIIFPALLIPEWVFRVVVITSLAGFPVAVILAWVFQWTPEGLRRTGEGDSEGPIVARFRRSRVAYMVGGAILLAGVSAVWWLRPRSAAGSVAPGAEVIAVLPFTSPGSDELGEGMVDLLSRNLDEVEGVRLVDPRMVLHRWNARAERGPVTRPIELEIGREVEAGSILTGSVIRLGEEVEIEADLVALDGTRLARAGARGTADDLFGLVDQLSVQLLSEVWRATSDVPEVGLRDVTTGSVEAMRAFLEGERRYRASAWPQALNAYRQAVSADTGFALAYYRLTRTLGWMGGDNDALRSRYADLALHFEDRLPTRMRGLAVSERLWLDGQREASIDSLEASVKRYPDDPEAWHRLADNQYHDEVEGAGPIAPPVDRQLETFERVLQLDPTFLPAIIHPIEVAFRYDDTARVARYTEMVERAPSTHPLAAQILRAAEEFERDPSNVLAIVQTLTLVLPVSGQGPGLPRQMMFAVLPAAERAAAGLASSDREMLITWLRPQTARPGATGAAARRFLLSTLVAGGRLAEARDVAASLTDSQETAVFWRDPVYAGYADVDHLDAMGGVVPSPLVRATAELVRGVRLGNADEARRVSAVARDRAGEGEGADDWSALARVATGFATALGGVPRGLDEVEAALSELPMRTGSFTEPLWFAWLDLSARTPAKRERAIPLLERPWTGSPVFDVARLWSLGTALAEVGREDEAREAFGRFAAVLTNADPGLPIRSAVEYARTAAVGLDPAG